jgi:hypothetical protein
MQSRIERELVCVLTDGELQSRATMLCNTVGEIDQVQHDKKDAMKEYQDQLTALQEQQRKLVRTIRERSERRIVACAVLWHTPAEGVKRIVRLDTGEPIAEESMTDSEKQLNLFAAQQEFATYMQNQGVDEAPENQKPDTADLDEEGPEA